MHVDIALDDMGLYSVHKVHDVEYCPLGRIISHAIMLEGNGYRMMIAERWGDSLHWKKGECTRVYV